MLPDNLQFIISYILAETGIVYDKTNTYQLETRLEEIIAHFKLTGLPELVQILKANSNTGVKQKVLDHSTNNETLFFRDPGFYAALNFFIETEILKQNLSEIKIWSAAASTGQEAVSIAILLDEMRSKHILPPVTIHATDLSERAIAKAKSGIYNDFEIKRGLSDERKLKYFSRQTDGWKVKDEILSKINFGINNLIRPSFTGDFNIILCRNVLIYQSVDVKAKVFDYLLSNLRPNGAILLGVGETMLGVKNNLETNVIENVIFYKKARAAA